MLEAASTDVQWCIWQLEGGTMVANQQWKIYIEFIRPVTLFKASCVLPNADWSVCRETQQQAIHFCTEYIETYTLGIWEWGSGNDYQSDPMISCFVDHVVQPSSVSRLVMQQPAIVAEFSLFYNCICSALSLLQFQHRPPRITVLWGPKPAMLLNEAVTLSGDVSTFCPSRSGDIKWFDKYEDEKHVLIEGADMGFIPLTELLSFLEKGQPDLVNSIATHVFMTATLHPAFWNFDAQPSMRQGI